MLAWLADSWGHLEYWVNPWSYCDLYCTFTATAPASMLSFFSLSLSFFLDRPSHTCSSLVNLLACRMLPFVAPVTSDSWNVLCQNQNKPLFTKVTEWWGQALHINCLCRFFKSGNVKNNHIRVYLSLTRLFSDSKPLLLLLLVKHTDNGVMCKKNDSKPALLINH